MPLTFNAMFLKHRPGISEIEAPDKENEWRFQAWEAKIKAHAWVRTLWQSAVGGQTAQMNQVGWKADRKQNSLGNAALFTNTPTTRGDILGQAKENNYLYHNTKGLGCLFLMYLTYHRRIWWRQKNSIGAILCYVKVLLQSLEQLDSLSWTESKSTVIIQIKVDTFSIE